MAKREGWSPEARKRAALARRIKTRFGQVAYENFKRNGTIPPGLEDTPTLASRKAQQAKSDPVSLQAHEKLPPPHTVTKPDDFLKSLQPGDLVRDKDGQRLRIQKTLPAGLRVRDQKEGARDLTWDQLSQLQLYSDPEQGPEGRQKAARRQGELREEAKALGIDVTRPMTIKDLEKAIGEAKYSGGGLDQIDPMLATDAKNNQDFDIDKPWRSEKMHRLFWDNGEWVAEEKLDGVRLKLHFGAAGVRTDSRRRDASSRRFSEKSPNFPHLEALNIPELEGTVLDGEGMMSVTSGVLPSGVKFHGALSVSTAATNASPEVAREIQDRFGPMQFWVFDVLRVKGKDVSHLPFADRRKALQKIVEIIHKKAPPAAEFLRTTRLESDSKVELFEEILESGGEGVMLKKLTASYEEGKRAKTMQKLKKFQEIDAYVVGWKPGKGGNEGYVGALELAVKIDGKEIGIAAISQFTEDLRKQMTAPDGSLKPEYYGDVWTFRGQEMTKNGRFRHAIPVGHGPRADKSKDDIDGYEVRDELIERDVLGEPESKDDGLDNVFDEPPTQTISISGKSYIGIRDRAPFEAGSPVDKAFKQAETQKAGSGQRYSITATPVEIAEIIEELQTTLEGEMAVRQGGSGADSALISALQRDIERLRQLLAT